MCADNSAILIAVCSTSSVEINVISWRKTTFDLTEVLLFSLYNALFIY